MFNNLKYKVDQTLNIWFPNRQDKMLQRTTKMLVEGLWHKYYETKLSDIRPKIRSICDMLSINENISKLEEIKTECVRYIDSGSQKMLDEWDLLLKEIEFLEKRFKERRDLKGKIPEESIENNKNENDKQ